MKLKIDNPTGERFTANLCGVRFTVLPHTTGDKATVKDDLPDNVPVQKWIESMKTMYRAVKITRVDEDDEELSAESQVKEPPLAKKAKIDPKDLKAFEEFKAFKTFQAEADEEALKTFEAFRAFRAFQKVADADALKAFEAFQDFQTKASVERGTSGWWTVKVENIDMPFKVRGCDDEPAAIVKAYEEFLEGNNP